MGKRLIAGLAAAGLGGLVLAGAAVSKDDPFGGRHGRWSALSPEDRAAFADARIAALHAGLKLNADQEKLWPPVETAMRDMSRLRREQREAMRERGRMVDDAPGVMRAMADAMTARGEALRKLADASTPLYATLDPDQKRRAAILARPMRPHGGFHGWRGRHEEDGGR